MLNQATSGTGAALGKNLFEWAKQDLPVTPWSVTSNGGARESSMKEVRADVMALMEKKKAVRIGNKITATLTRGS